MEGRHERLHPSSWFGLRVTRRLSPYVTRIFLKLGVSANQCTVLGTVLTIGVGIAFTVPEPVVWLFAALLRYVVIVLDCVDGELARFNGTSGPEGTYLEAARHQFEQPYLVACMAVGLFSGLGGVHVVVVGLGAVLGASLMVAHEHMVRSVAWEWQLLPDEHSSHSDTAASFMKHLRRVADVVLVTPGVRYVPQVVVTSFIDMFTRGFQIGGMAFDARLVWLAVFALGTLAAAVLRTAMTVTRGIKAEL